MNWRKTNTSKGNSYRHTSSKYDFYIFKYGNTWTTDAKISKDSNGLWIFSWNTSKTLKSAKEYVESFVE